MNTSLLPLIVAGCCFIVADGAKAQDVLWTSDTNDQFSLTLNGSGIPSGTAASPSGLWQLNYAFNFSEWDSKIYLSQGSSSVAFLPEPSLNLVYPAYTDWLNGTLPAYDGNTSDNYTGLGSQGWHGNLNITILSQPDVGDPTTWTWQIAAAGNGPAIAVPEPTWSAWLLIWIATTVVILPRRRVPAGGRVR